MVESRQSGFSLLEMSLALIILGVLCSAFLSPFHLYTQRKKEFEACEEIEKIRQALLDFAVVHGRLPWAAHAAGVESHGKEQGLLPWQTLSLSGPNVWNGNYHYHVLANWADQRADPEKVARCEVHNTLNHLSVNFCSQGRLRVQHPDGRTLYDKAVVLVTQTRPVTNKARACEPRITWLAAETVLGHLVTAGRLY